MWLFKDRSEECFLEGNRDTCSLKGEVNDGGQNTIKMYDMVVEWYVHDVIVIVNGGLVVSA